MNKINQYYAISLIKPEYHITYPLFYKASRKRILFNGLELELYYSKEFDSYVTNEELMNEKNNEKNKRDYNGKKSKKGGFDNYINIIYLGSDDDLHQM